MDIENGAVVGLMTVEELAQTLGVSLCSMRTMLKRQQVPREVIRKLGRRVRFDRQAVKAWLDTLIPGEKTA